MIHTQTFQAGMVQDVDPHFQPPNTYRSGDNVQLMYNPDDADVTMGHGLALMNARGNRRVASARDGYVILGEADCSKGTLLFSTNNVDCEISIWYWDSADLPGIVEVLYSDAYDPNVVNVASRQRGRGESNQDRLNWKATDEADMDIVVSYENQLAERVYWTDRKHCVHTFNLNDAWNAQGVRLHKLSEESGSLYPKFWSVHAFRERSDLVFPRIKYKGRGKGRLLSGAYQIAVQYQDRNGHDSVWSMLDRRVIVTTNPLDDESPNRQTALRANHHNRVMAPSGQMSRESLRYELSGLDVRWEKVRVAVVYHQSPDKPFRRVALRPVTITGPSMVVEIAQLDGEELNDAAFSQRYENMLSVGTIASSDNQLLAGNLKLLPAIAMETDGVRYTPLLRPMEADQTQLPRFESKANAVSNRNDNDPITNSLPTTTELTMSAFTGVTERYSVEDDYANYKGQQYDHLLKGHFRGETYEYGAMVIDRAGQPMFVQPLPDFTFPEQYEKGPRGEADYYALTKLNASTGRFDLQIMTVLVSGLALPVADLYDQDGRLNVSGFMIVRRKRKPTVAHQGVVFPVCATSGCWIKQDRDFTLYPLPTPDNGFGANSIGDDRYQNGIRKGECQRNNNSAPDFGYAVTQPYYMLYHSPDVLIEEGMAAPEPGDRLKHVGIVRNAYSPRFTELAGDNSHVYTKNYNTRTDFARLADLTLRGRPALGDTTRLGLHLIHNLGYNQTYEEIDKDHLKLKLETQTHPIFLKKVTDQAYLDSRVDGLLQRNAVLFKSPDWKSVDVSDAEPTASNWQSSYRVVSYIKSVSRVAAEKEPYFSTGHFQPITQEILKLAKERHTDGKLSHYVFDDVEVGGGDAYVSIFDFTRLYPYWSEGCEKITYQVYPDYAVSLALPIESKYNLAMRWGRSFAANGTKPQATSCDNSQLQFMNGITAQQPEDWKYNAVLNLEETVQFYNAKDPDLKLTSDRPSDFGWTPAKSSGQRLDAWRTRYVGDIGQADGSCGPITKLSTGSFAHVYVWQSKGLGAAPLNAANFQAGETGTVVVSSGRTFQGMIYLTKESGTQHPASVWVSKGQIGAWDARAGVLLRHSQAGLDELSRIENLHDTIRKMSVGLGASDLATLRRWNAVSGVNDNGDVLTTFSYMGKGQKTVVYSPSINAFVGTLPMMPRRYGRRGQYLFSQPAGAGANQLWLHQGGLRGQYFGITYPSSVCFIVNVSPTVSKRFDNGHINLNLAGFDKIVKLHQYTPNGGFEQDHTILKGDERIEWRNNELVYPMHEWDWDEKKRPLRDHYAIVEITIDNTGNVPVELLSFSTSFLPIQ